MNYVPDFMPSCQKTIDKAIRKNSVLAKILFRKINEIIQNPHHYKPLRHNLAGERRVHILKSFVLSFRIDETNKTVIFLKFGHHDKAY
ncbi:MAG: type II toxin-antitoxin system mRNA interferase toxin, RelE/StbE family [Nanoarchaeota archaeon]